MRVVHNPDPSEQDDFIASPTKGSLDRSGMISARQATEPRPAGNTVSITGGILSSFGQLDLYIPGGRIL